MSHVHIYKSYYDNNMMYGWVQGDALSVGWGQLGVLRVEGQALAEVVFHGTIHMFNNTFQIVTFIGICLKQVFGLVCYLVVWKGMGIWSSQNFST